MNFFARFKPKKEDRDPNSNCLDIWEQAENKEKAGDLRGALADYDKTLELHPDHPNILVVRAIVNSKLGE